MASFKCALWLLVSYFPTGSSDQKERNAVVEQIALMATGHNSSSPFTQHRQQGFLSISSKTYSLCFRTIIHSCLTNSYFEETIDLISQENGPF